MAATNKALAQSEVENVERALKSFNRIILTDNLQETLVTLLERKSAIKNKLDGWRKTFKVSDYIKKAERVDHSGTWQEFKEYQKSRLPSNFSWLLPNAEWLNPTIKDGATLNQLLGIGQPTGANRWVNIPALDYDLPSQDVLRLIPIFDKARRLSRPGAIDLDNELTSFNLKPGTKTTKAILQALKAWLRECNDLRDDEFIQELLDDGLLSEGPYMDDVIYTIEQEISRFENYASVMGEFLGSLTIEESYHIVVSFSPADFAVLGNIANIDTNSCFRSSSTYFAAPMVLAGQPNSVVYLMYDGNPDGAESKMIGRAWGGFTEKGEWWISNIYGGNITKMQHSFSTIAQLIFGDEADERQIEKPGKVDGIYVNPVTVHSLKFRSSMMDFQHTYDLGTYYKRCHRCGESDPKLLRACNGCTESIHKPVPNSRKLPIYTCQTCWSDGLEALESKKPGNNTICSRASCTVPGTYNHCGRCIRKAHSSRIHGNKLFCSVNCCTRSKQQTELPMPAVIQAQPEVTTQPTLS